MHGKRKAAAMRNALIASVAVLAGPALAGPGDGPVIQADSIVIQNTVRGEITNGKQGSSWEVCVLFCFGGGSSTKSGLLNVNGIVQTGNSVLQARQIVLQNDLPHNLNNKDGTQNYKGIMQLGR